MKVFVREYCRDVTVRIYGIDGEERTKEFFRKYFSEVDGVYETTDEEREDYNSEAVYTITKQIIITFSHSISSISKRALTKLPRRNFAGKPPQDYTFENCCYVI